MRKYITMLAILLATITIAAAQSPGSPGDYRPPSWGQTSGWNSFWASFSSAFGGSVYARYLF